MLNYIWSGLIILSLLFAIVQDSYDLYYDTYQNEREYQVEVGFPNNGDPDVRQKVRFSTAGMDTSLQATWKPTARDTQMAIPVNEALPQIWQKIAENQKADDKEMLQAVVTQSPKGDNYYRVDLPDVRFVKMRAIADEAFSMAEFAVDLAIGLIGAMALWLGLMRIAEKSGMIRVFNRIVYPVLKYLFPNIPKDHPAYAAISLNMAANILGLGNAATPLGIKAMEELQKLNTTDETATDSMCMFLAINTSSVQLLPPVTLIAILGTGVNEIMISIILATSVSTVVGITAAKYLAYRNRATRTDWVEATNANTQNGGDALSNSSSDTDQNQ